MSKETYISKKTVTRTKTLSWKPTETHHTFTFKMEAADARGKDSIVEKSVKLLFTSQGAVGDGVGVPEGLDVPGFPLFITLATVVVLSKKLRRNNKNDPI